MNQLLKYFHKISSLLIVGSLFAYVSHAQETKKGIALVNTDIIYKELPAFKVLNERIESLKQEGYAHIQKINENNNDTLVSYQETLKRLAIVGITDADRKSLTEKQQELGQKILKIQEYIKQEQYRVESAVNAFVTHKISKDKQDLKNQLNQLAREHGYEMLLDKSFQTEQKLPFVSYHADKLDQTEFFLSLLLDQ